MCPFKLVIRILATGSVIWLCYYTLSSPLSPTGLPDCIIMPGSVQTNEAHPSKGFLRRAHSVFALLGGVYLLAVILLSIPFFQTQ